MGNDFCEKLNKCRNELKYNKREMAKYLDISESYYNLIENGKREPSRNVLMKLKNHNGLIIDYWPNALNLNNSLSYTESLIDSMIKEKVISSISDLRKESIKEILLNVLEKDIERKLNNE